MLSRTHYSQNIGFLNIGFELDAEMQYSVAWACVLFTTAVWVAPSPPITAPQLSSPDKYPCSLPKEHDLWQSIVSLYFILAFPGSLVETSASDRNQGWVLHLRCWDVQFYFPWPRVIAGKNSFRLLWYVPIKLCQYFCSIRFNLLLLLYRLEFSTLLPICWLCECSQTFKTCSLSVGQKTSKYKCYLFFGRMSLPYI